MFKKITKIVSSGATFFALASPAYAQAGSFQIVRSGTAGVNDIGSLISAVFNMAIIFAIIFVFFMLLLGGYGWISAGGDKAKVEEARTRITNALIGLAIVASAWAIITIVAKFFGLSFDNFEIPSAAGS